MKLVGRGEEKRSRGKELTGNPRNQKRKRKHVRRRRRRMKAGLHLLHTHDFVSDCC